MVLSEPVRNFLDQPLIGRISVIDEEGYPHTIPIWFIRDGDEVMFISDPPVVMNRVGIATASLTTAELRPNKPVATRARRTTINVHGQGAHPWTGCGCQSGTARGVGRFPIERIHCPGLLAANRHHR